MNSGKQGNYSEAASSDENDEQERGFTNDETTGTGRSYECTFCKRGFTNAQALGGHMNIHRKDKAKAKQQQQQQQHSTTHDHDQTSSLSSKSNEAHMISRYYPVQFYFPASNPSSYPPLASHQSEFHHHHTKHNEDQNLGSNLSLTIGSSPDMEDGNNKEKRRDGTKKERIMENEVDLELRLGHIP